MLISLIPVPIFRQALTVGGWCTELDAPCIRNPTSNPLAFAAAMLSRSFESRSADHVPASAMATGAPLGSLSLAPPLLARPRSLPDRHRLVRSDEHGWRSEHIWEEIAYFSINPAPLVFIMLGWMLYDRVRRGPAAVAATAGSKSSASRAKAE